jgi:alginate O-acetyltransferase complex protein AlgI
VSRPTRRLIDFACYVSLFPQLIAGPIVRYNEIADQLAERSHTATKLARGLCFFIIGLVKKALLADTLAPVAELAFDHGPPGAAVAWIGLLAYAFQIYFDFSGYSDMAIGLGLLLGFEFPQNFNSPYQATSIRDFWRRWHMSLSRWLRDYLYFSLGGSRSGVARTYVNIMATMLLGGLWHGANWTFVLWGGYHGVLICIERALGERNPLSRLPAGLKRAGTFLLVLLGWVLFRSASLGGAAALSGQLLGRSGLGRLPDAMHSAEFLIAFPIAVVVAFGSRDLFAWRWRITARTAAWVVPLFLASLYAVLTSGYSPFLYFQF